jgi:hypothetical protein
VLVFFVAVRPGRGEPIRAPPAALAAAAFEHGESDDAVDRALLEVCCVCSVGGNWAAAASRAPARMMRRRACEKESAQATQKKQRQHRCLPPIPDPPPLPTTHREECH